MAVSGRKVDDFQGSISKGSAEDFDHRCEPCLAIGQEKETHGFCVDCEEHLCTTCFAYHQRTKASKHHQLVNKEQMVKIAIPLKDSGVCTEMCLNHKNEVIKFFCPKHEVLGCNDCMTMDHRTCDIDYIPDKCSGIGDSVEFREVMRELDQKVNVVEAIAKQASYRENELESFYDKLLQQITKFRNEINDRLDQLQNKIQTDADRKKAADKQTIKDVLETCTGFSADIKQLQSRLQDYKASQQNGQLYIAMKQAKSKLKIDDIKESDKSLERTNLQYTFEQNQDLKYMLSRQTAFGQLTLSSTKRGEPIEKLTLKGNINMKTKSDQNECCIRECVVPSSSKLVVADYYNRKLKVVDTKTKAVIEETNLSTGPWGIAVIPQDQIAVTMPNKKEIHIMTTVSKLSAIRTFPVRGECRGIDYHQGYLFTVSWNPKCVFITDTQGNLQSTIKLNDKRFNLPNHLLLSKDLRHIFISDNGSHSVISITLQGDTSAVYANKGFYYPLGMMMLDNGSLLVCCSGSNGSIHRISGDLNECNTMIDGLLYPYSICYNRDQHEVYVGCLTDQMIVLSTK